jgi:hypothetical protein
MQELHSKKYEAMVQEVKERIGANEEGYASIIEDVANHGADTGFSGFTYTADCVEFFDAHEEVIMNMLSDAAEEFGYKSVPAFVASFGRADMAESIDGYKNLLAWYALEEVCRQLVDEGSH